MTTSPTDELREQIAEHRRKNALRRAGAFVDCPERVLGMRVNPITVRTWTMLFAAESRFVLGGTPMEGDVRNFLWFHSRLFTVGPLAKPLRWLALLPFSARLHLRRDVDYYCAAIALATADIGRIIDDVLADAPKGHDKSGRPAAACLEAQMTHLFSKEYGWSPAQIRSLPLCRLIQLCRCFGDDEEDPEEFAIKCAHLRKRNEALAAERAAKKEEPKTETVA